MVSRSGFRANLRCDTQEQATGWMHDEPTDIAQAEMLEDLRSRYERAVRDLGQRASLMRRDGASSETIARALHGERLHLATRFKQLTPEPYRSQIYERTVRVYGNDLGPTIDALRAAGKSWEAIIEGAIRPGPRLTFDGDQG